MLNVEGRSLHIRKANIPGARLKANMKGQYVT
jgi:hypothetical protein